MVPRVGGALRVGVVHPGVAGEEVRVGRGAHERERPHQEELQGDPRPRRRLAGDLVDDQSDHDQTEPQVVGLGHRVQAGREVGEAQEPHSPRDEERGTGDEQGDDEDVHDHDDDLRRV